jgi:hypothetical protein
MARFHRTFRGRIRPVLVEGMQRFELDCERGCRRTNADKEGNVTSVERENRELRANLGDTLIVIDDATGEFAMVSVTAILADGRKERHRVKLVCGELVASEHDVFVKPAQGISRLMERRRKRRAA